MARFKRSLVISTAAAVLAVLLSGSTGGAQTETIDTMLSRACPAANALAKEEKRAHDLAEESRYPLAKKAATLYYDCFQQLNDAYARDWAHFEYLRFLSLAPPADDETKTVQTLTIVGDGANELAGSTQFSDVRKAALWLRDNVRDELSHLAGSSP